MSIVLVNKLSESPVKTGAITQLVQTVARRFDPERIILFGSYAYGNPTEDSDVDLLIVMSHRGPGYRVATKIRLGLDVKFPMDLLVRSAAELRKGVSQRDWFSIEVLEKGIVLHDRANPAVGAKGRRRLRRRLASAAVSKTQPL
jgi:predicted nucleotidyltransferase